MDSTTMIHVVSGGLGQGSGVEYSAHCNTIFKRKGLDMDNVTLIRIISGVLFVIVLGILIQRRRTSVK
jgi:hypothetical protein